VKVKGIADMVKDSMHPLGIFIPSSIGRGNGRLSYDGAICDEDAVHFSTSACGEDWNELWPISEAAFKLS
jgi:hypothetical protein